ncbi:guided entry of tail-anchored proteins factor 1 [Aplysia californica]|uniref:Guided entry of tail-anchored proteins factor 1 n=1 Tax=Aplysia californica TaxID=6500 RepID=A0ABM0K681_APLCA|nr:guided entry of tail-anchored proteins factor 1 [Aplysia californica]
MYLMVFIFLLEVFFALVPKYVGEISAMIGKTLFKITDNEMSVRSEIADLKEEQSGLSVTDDFAKYARLQRRIDKLLSQVKEKGGERKSRVTYLRMVVTVAIYVVHALIMLGLMVSLRSQPLLTFPPSWVSPLTKLVAFPTGIPGALGLGCWLLVSNSVIYRGKMLAGI